MANHFDYLASASLHLVDCTVTDTQVNAGWVYMDGNLKETEVLADSRDEVQLPIKIHPKIQEIKNQSEFFLRDDVIEFYRC